MTDSTALQATVKLIVDAIKDTAQAVSSGQSTWSSALLYQNLVGDLFSVVPNLSTLPAQLQSLTLQDVQVLLGVVAADLGVFAPETKNILLLAQTLLKDLSPSFIADLVALVEKIIASVQKKPAATFKTQEETQKNLLLAGTTFYAEAADDAYEIHSSAGLALGFRDPVGFMWLFPGKPETLTFPSVAAAQAKAKQVADLWETPFTVERKTRLAKEETETKVS